MTTNWDLRITLMIVFVFLGGLSSLVHLSRPKTAQTIAVNSQPFSVTESPDRATDKTKVAWLLSFPQSGRRFTLENVMKVSNKTTVMNISDINNDLLDNERHSILPHYYVTGPCSETRNKFSSEFIVVATHCSYDFITSSYLFREKCFITSTIYSSTNKRSAPIENCRKGHCREEIQHDIHAIKKIVHLIRDPFENTIASFNHENENNITNVRWLDEHLGEYYDAFHLWCKNRDKQLSEIELHYFGMDFPLDVPCYSEFFKYVQWHNNAFALSAELGIPTLIVHYEDYRIDMERTVEKITSFLELDIVSESLEFSSIDHNFIFSERQRKATINFILKLASKSTKDNLDRYFYLGSWPKIAWLMSYPASGTTYTLEMVKRVSNRTVAYNNGHEHASKYSQQVHSTYTSGPFLDQNDISVPLPDKYILTKTHCHHPATFVNSPYLFRKGCLSGKRFYPPEDKSKAPDSKECTHIWCEEEVTYDINMVKKIVYNIRNPFENIVSRFNNFHKPNISHVEWLHENHDKYREAFHAWCEERDSQVTEHDVAFYGKDLPANVVCKSEFFRFFQWHNYATGLISELEIPTLVLHYDNFEDIDATVNGLMQFLELDSVSSPLPFSPHSYSFMYSDVDRKAIKDWAVELVSKEAWKHLKVYFTNID